MNDFEKQYYETDSFWQGEMLQDEANKERIRITSDMVPGDVKSLLDVGCGNGAFVNYLQAARPELDILGVDRSTAALRYVRTKKEEGDISHLRFADKVFDCVTCLEVVEHLPVPVFQKSLDELARVAGKYIIISVPYNEKLEESFNQCPSCKTIFNYELHLRSFSDDYFRQLFDGNDFTCMSVKKLGASSHYKGHHQFRKMFYKEQFRQWKAPICPICGFHNEKQEDVVHHQPPSNSARPKFPGKAISYLTALPKLIWPKETKYYWILGLFKRNA